MNNKNYLFAPFKEGEEVEEFNSLKEYLELNGLNSSELVLFIGRLESTYDVIITELKAELKDEKYYSSEYEKKAKAENEKLKSGMDAVENAYLKEKIKRLKAERVKRVEYIAKVEEENEDLRKGCKLLKDTSHHPKEYKAEAEEYFHHVPEAKEVYFFMLSEWEMKDAESGDLMIDKDNALCIIKNLQNEKYCLNLPR